MKEAAHLDRGRFGASPNAYRRAQFSAFLLSPLTVTAGVFYAKIPELSLRQFGDFLAIILLSENFAEVFD